MRGGAKNKKWPDKSDHILYKTSLEGLSLPSHEPVHYYGNSSIARDIACGAETVHSDIKGYHQSLGLLVETEHGLQKTERGHDCSARYSWSRNHSNTQHAYKAHKHSEIIRHALHDHQGKSAGYYLERASGHVDGCA